MNTDKILCITVSEGRPDITRIFLAGMKRCGISVMGLCLDYESGQVYSEMNNKDFWIEMDVIRKPLAQYWNKIFLAAMGCWDWEYLMISGDDDVYDLKYFEKAEESHFVECDFFGLSDLYFLDPFGKRAKKLSYTTKYKVMGPGRIIKRSTLRKVAYRQFYQFKVDFKDYNCDYKKGEIYQLGIVDAIYFTETNAAVKIGGGYNLWHPSLDKRLDASSDYLLSQHGIFPQVISHPSGGAYVTDIKSAKNIWGYNEVQGVECPYQDAISFWGDEERALLDRYLNTKN